MAEIDEVEIIGSRLGGAMYQPGDIGLIGAALAAYMSGFYDPYNLYANPGIAAGGGAAPPPPEPAEPEQVATVVVTAPRAPAPLPTGGDLLDDLLRRPPAPPPPPPPPPSLFEEIISRPPQSPLDEVLQRNPQFRPELLDEVKVTAKRGLRAVSRWLGPLGVVAFLPDLYHAGVRLDELATDSWLNRLGEPGKPPPAEPDDGGRSSRRRRPATRSPAGDVDDELPEVTVTGRAPRGSYLDPLRLAPIGFPMADPLGPAPIFATAPTGAPPGVVNVTVPGLEFLPAPGASPLPSLLAPPSGGSPPRPGTGTASPPRGPAAPPAVTWPGGLGSPAPPCDCSGGGSKKKPKKKKPRNVCWKGSYVERSMGLTKTKRVRVSCATGEELG